MINDDVVDNDDVDDVDDDDDVDVDGADDASLEYRAYNASNAAPTAPGAPTRSVLPPPPPKGPPPQRHHSDIARMLREHAGPVNDASDIVELDWPAQTDALSDDSIPARSSPWSPCTREHWMLHGTTWESAEKIVMTCTYLCERRPPRSLGVIRVADLAPLSPRARARRSRAPCDPMRRRSRCDCIASP